MEALIKIFIVDDHQILIDGIMEIIQKSPHLKVLATADTGERALELLVSNEFDLAITDIGLPDMEGADLIVQFKKQKPDMKVLALSMHFEKYIVKKVLKMGADGYVLKKSTHNELLEAIDTVMRGEVFLSHEITKLLVDDVRNPSVEALLSEREVEIIRLIAAEKTTRMIAEELHISEKTVESHKTNIFRKTGTSTLVGLTKFAIKHRLVDMSHE